MVNEPLFSDPVIQDRFAIARHLLACYNASRDGLKELKILRNERTVQGDLAEWIVARRLGLNVVPSTVMKDIDAVHPRTKKTYQIKSRIVQHTQQSTSFDFRGATPQFDYLVAVFFDLRFDVLRIIQVERDVVQELSTTTASTRRFRWKRSVAADPRVKTIYHRSEPDL
jgi:hypothetical protein